MGDNKYKDMRGVLILEGDYVCYGKSSRHNPVNLGVVKSIGEEGIKVLGDGCTKEGLLSSYNISNRVLVLPEHYKDKE